MGKASFLALEVPFHLEDVNVIANERIMIKDGSLFGIEEVILIFCGLGHKI